MLVANHVEVYSGTVDPVGTDPFQLLIVFSSIEVSIEVPSWWQRDNRFEKSHPPSRG